MICALKVGKNGFIKIRYILLIMDKKLFQIHIKNILSNDPDDDDPTAWL
jgi:hypothetical protein